MNRENGSLARLRAAFAAGAGEAPRPEDCPPPERLYEAVAGALPAAELRAVVEHTALCPSCAEDWRIAAALGAEAPAVAVFPVPSRAPLRRLRPWAAALAAAVVLVVAGLALKESLLDREPPVYREGGQVSIRSLVPDGEALPREGFLLRWEAVPEALSYDLLLSTSDLRVLAGPAGLTSPEYQVPQEALAGLPAGTRLHWQVEATLAGGGRVASEAFLVTLR